MEVRDEVAATRDNIRGTQKEIDQIVSRVKNFETQSEQLAHYFSGKALKGFFEERADAEKTVADDWTKYTWWFAIGTTLVLAASVAYALFGASKRNTRPTGDCSPQRVYWWRHWGLSQNGRLNGRIVTFSKNRNTGGFRSTWRTIDSSVASVDKDTRDQIFKEVALRTFTDGTGNDTSTELDSD